MQPQLYEFCVSKFIDLCIRAWSEFFGITQNCETATGLQDAHEIIQPLYTSESNLFYVFGNELRCLFEMFKEIRIWFVLHIDKVRQNWILGTKV